MATRNIVPRATGEGSIGTSAKTWGAVYADDIAVTNGVTASTFTGDLTGDVTGTASGNLPLSGGTMTGTITASSDAMQSDSNDSSLFIYGGNGSGNGAYIIVCGKDEANYPGGFLLRAHDGTNSSYLIGRPNATLTWNAKEVERVNASGSSYIRYESGLQICWGSASSVTSSGKAVTYPAAFSANPALVVSSQTANNTWWTDRTTTGATLKINSTSGYSVYYIAIGYWK